MNYLQRMNNALDYIESNLDGEIDYTIAANLACYSVFYFQRIFSLITDVSLSEYIRRRRMTLAAFELQNSKVKITDLAIKFGYESADSFSRAFQSLHGIIPTQARISGVSLKAYPRMTFLIMIKGDVAMNYRMENKEAFRIVGIKRSFRVPDESDVVVPAFWDEIYNEGIAREMLEISTGTPKGIHGFLQVIDEESVDYTIASISDEEPPIGMSSQIVPKSTWAIFEVNGSVNTAMSDVWKRIFTEWLPTSNYKHAETLEIECFPYAGDKRAANYKFEIWIPVVKIQ